MVLVHRYGGLAMAGFLTIAGITGSVLAFQSEIDAWLNPHLFHVEGRGAALSVSQLVDRIEAAVPGADVQTIILPAAPGDSACVFVAATGKTPLIADELFVDPTNGKLLGARLWGTFRPDAAHLVPFLYRLHRSLLVPGRWGAWLMGGVALAWMLNCVVGLCLTLPLSRPFWRRWKPAWTIKRGAGGYRFNLDLHRAFGLWMWAVLFLVALSGVALNLRRELFRPVLAAIMPTIPEIQDRPAPVKPPMIRLDWDAALASARAEAARRGWGGPVGRVYLDRHLGFYAVSFGRPHQAGFGPSVIYVSPGDGRILAVDGAEDGKVGDGVARLMYPIHSGQVAGLPGRILISFTGLVVAMLSVTGVYIWWKKRARRVTRKAAAHTARRILQSSQSVAAE